MHVVGVTSFNEAPPAKGGKSDYLSRDDADWSFASMRPPQRRGGNVSERGDADRVQMLQ